MLKITCKGILLILVCLVIQTGFILADTSFFTGKLKVSETDYSGKKPKNYNYQLKYYQNNTCFRLDTPKYIYYLIDIATQKVFLINKKRKSITNTTLDSIINFPIPPVSIFNNKTATLNYLSKINARRYKYTEDHNINKFDAWRFKLNNNTEYNVIYKLPQYSLTRLCVNAQKTKLIIEVIPDKTTRNTPDKDKLLMLPEGFKIVDLTPD